ncbi:MAG: hypothetical protein EHM70_03820 [Chloroflexota bacterium]|nr:MAG: hypothetical protein EHM70_03820 [Chloroflexota bacterium]
MSTSVSIQTNQEKAHGQAGRRETLARLLMFAPLLVCVLLMLPRLVSPHFGLFDDGTTIIRAQEIASGTWNLEEDLEAGRTRPLYWLFYTATYSLFGANPFWFFVVNTLVLAGTALGILYLVRQMGGSRLQAGLTALLFALSGPVIENFYTLSKAEPLQMALLVLSMVWLAPFARLNRRWKKGLAFLAATLTLLLAAAAKETTLFVFPISAVWLAAAWIRRLRGSSEGFEARGTYFLANGLAVAGSLALRSLFVSQGLTSGSYTNGYVIDPARMLSAALSWLGWLGRDFIYLVPLVLLAVAVFVARKKISQEVLLFDSLVWMAAWVAVYLPWSFTIEYYLLPFAFGFSFFAGILLVQALDLLKTASQPWRIAVGALLGVTLILFLVTQANNATNARIQLTIDEANAEVLDFVAANAPQGATVLVNIQFSNEYIRQIRSHLTALRHRSDLSVDQFKFQGIDPNEPGLEPHFILSPSITNQPLLAVRMGEVEETQVTWNKTLKSTLDVNWTTILTTNHAFPMLNIDIPRLFCPLAPALDYCALSIPIIDRRAFTYGWTVYNLELP